MTVSGTSANKQLTLSWPFRAAQVIWLILAGLSILILIASIPQYFGPQSLGVFENHLILPDSTAIIRLVQFTQAASLFSATVSVILAIILFIKKRSDRMGLFLAYYLLGHGILFAGPIEMLHPYWPDAALVNSFILLPIFFGPATIALVVLFPDGRFVPHWSRWLVIFALVTSPIALVNGGQLTQLNQIWGTMPAAAINAMTVIGALLVISLTIYCQYFRYRRMSPPDQRLQTKWVIYGFVLWLIVGLASSIAWTLALQLPKGSMIPVWLPIASLAWILSSLILPVSLTIAITRYRLFEIDHLINRTLVYGTLTIGVILIYIIIVAVLGVLFQTQANLLLAFLATAVIAVIFQPLRSWLQKGVDRLIFGQRDNPIEALSQMGRRLEGSIPPDQVLPQLVETIAHSLKLPYVAIFLWAGDSLTPAASYGRRVHAVESFPLLFQGEELGQLRAATRGPGLSFSESEMQLLRNVARQAGTAVQAVQLTHDLQRSRRKIVTTREEERRRLRRDLHDGLGPAMAGQSLKLDAAIDLINKSKGQGPLLDEAVELLQSLKTQTRDSISSVRHIVHGLRPPALDNLGLIPAIEAHISQQTSTQSGLQIVLQTPPDGLPQLTAAIELALYSITLEALNNVQRHAQAANCQITFKKSPSSHPQIHLSICDDGKGLPQITTPGVGLVSMRERALELGGHLSVEVNSPSGTCVKAGIPIADEGQ